jgi:octaprenyl-diphosphate synthase
MTQVNDISFIRTLVAEEMKAVDALILEQLEQSNAPLIPQLSRHILKAGGKRLRPILTLLAAKLCNYNSGSRHIHMAASVEFIHTATLLHDDVVDESALRRGEPTANAVWSNSASVLVGDFLLAKAFQMMVGDGSLAALKLLSDTSATLSEGEVLQLTSARDLATNREIYFRIIHAKTASLFATAAEIGGIVAGATKNECNALKEYGTALGLAFQIVDDALDYSAQTAQLGKQAGDDFREGKITLPIILAYEKASDEEQKFWQHALEDTANANDENLQTALNLIAKHNTIEASLKEAENQAQKAIKALTPFPESELKTALVTLAKFTVQREF